MTSYPLFFISTAFRTRPKAKSLLLRSVNLFTGLQKVAVELAC